MTSIGLFYLESIVPWHPVKSNFRAIQCSAPSRQCSAPSRPRRCSRSSKFASGVKQVFLTFLNMAAAVMWATEGFGVCDMNRNVLRPPCIVSMVVVLLPFLDRDIITTACYGIWRLYNVSHVVNGLWPVPFLSSRISRIAILPNESVDIIVSILSMLQDRLLTISYDL